MSDLKFELDAICSTCGKCYGDHYSDIEGDDFCPDSLPLSKFTPIEK